jgi:hypothetical protein
MVPAMEGLLIFAEALLFGRITKAYNNNKTQRCAFYCGPNLLSAHVALLLRVLAI